jgi:hypothetical protein
MAGTRGARGRDWRIAGVLVVVIAVLFVGLLWAGTRPPFAGLLQNTTISACREGEDPSTTLCYQPAVPS